MEPPIPPPDPMVIRREQRRQLLHTPSFIVGSVISLLWLACALAPGAFTRRSESDLVRDSEGVFLPRASPQAEAWLGTDSIGRDVFARVVYGAEDILLPALLAALMAVFAGAAIGLLMDTSRGWIDEALRRLSETVVSLPVVLLALVVSVVYYRSQLALVLTIAGLSAPLVVSAVRSAVLAETQPDGALALRPGETGRRDVLRQVLPAASIVLLVEFTVRFRLAIFAVATLAFLGFTVGDPSDPGKANWGRDFGDAYPLMSAGQWWSAIFPVLALTSVALATNLIGDSVDKVYRRVAPTE